MTTGNNVIHPTHHIRLVDAAAHEVLLKLPSDGGWNRTPYPTSSLKIYQGNEGYDDLQMPFSPVQQSDWSGGQGNTWHDENGAAYWSSHAADTNRAGQIIPGPFFVPDIQDQGQLAANAFGHWPIYSWSGGGSRLTYYWHTIVTSGTHKLAMKFRAPANATVLYALFIMRFKETTAPVVQVSLQADSAGSPSGTPLATITITGSNYTGQDMVVFPIHKVLSDSVALTASTYYWFVIEYVSGSGSAEVLCMSQSGLGAKLNTTGSWVNSNNNMFCAVYPDYSSGNYARFFEMRGALYCVKKEKADTKLYINGDNGNATGGTVGDLTDTSKAWVSNQWCGAIVKFTSGVASSQRINYVRILSNSATGLVFASNLSVAIGAGTDYAIIATNQWTLLHTWTNRAFTDVVARNVGTTAGQVYIAMGETNAIESVYFVTTTGYVYTTEAFLGQYLLSTEYNGALTLWRTDWFAGGMLYKHAFPTTGVAIGAASASINVGAQGDQITGLAVYGENGLPYVFKGRGVYEITIANNSVLLPIYEMAGVDDVINGRVSTQHNVYLYFSLAGNRIERYYNSRLDDVSPQNLPPAFQGEIVKITGYPGQLVIAIDATQNGYSTVLRQNGSGWNEVWRAPYGQCIRDIFFESIPGSNVDRLWIATDALVYWIPYNIEPWSAQYIGYNHYLFSPWAEVITSKIRGQLKSLDKLWQSLTLFYDKATGAVSGISAQVDYRTNDNSAWTTVLRLYPWLKLGEKQPLGPEVAGNSEGVQSNWIQFRIRIYSSYTNPGDGAQFQRLVNMLLDAVLKGTVTYQIALTTTIGEYITDLHEQMETQDPDTIIAQLESWARYPTPLQMYSHINQLDVSGLGGGNALRRVMLDPYSIKLTKLIKIEDTQQYLIELRLIELDISYDPTA